MAQLNANPARAITWFGGVTIYCTFFNNDSPAPRQFLCSKIFWKKLAIVREMLIEQNFESREPGSRGRIRTPTTGCFQDKAIIYKENIQVDSYFVIKYCRRQCILLPSTSAKSLTKFNPKKQDFKRVLDLNCQRKDD